MIDIRNICMEWAAENDLDLITDSTAGLNAVADRNISDREDAQDKDVLFLNIAETGTLQTTDTGRFITVSHTYEIGLFKKCLKEIDGDAYYDDSQYLLGQVVSLFIYMSKRLDLTMGSYSNAIDQLDSNNVCIRLQVSIDEKITIC